MRKRFQFSLRLCLLVMTLCATYFAWLGAIRSKNRSERSIDRINLEARLAATEKWHDMLDAEVRNIPATNGSRLRARTATLRTVEAEMLAMRKELQTME